MSNFVNDTFTGTNGTSILDHTGELGATWAPILFYITDANLRTTNWKIQSNAVGVDSSGFSPAAKASGTPLGANVAVELDLNYADTAHTTTVTMIARLSADELTHYLLNIDLANASSDVYLEWHYSGGHSSDSGHATTGLNLNGAHTVRWEIAGNDHTFKVDGTSVYTVTNTFIPASGKIGLQYLNSGANRIALIDRVTGTDLAASAFWTDFVKSAETVV